MSAARVRESVRRRSGGRCEARVECNGARAVLFHHRKRRAQGGRDTESILLHLCDPCHRFVHDRPALAYALGLLVHSWEDPELVAVHMGSFA